MSGYFRVGLGEDVFGSEGCGRAVEGWAGEVSWCVDSGFVFSLFIIFRILEVVEFGVVSGKTVDFIF